MFNLFSIVTTVLTVYGIETIPNKPNDGLFRTLQQYLPFTVLKRLMARGNELNNKFSYNSTYRLRY